jgi:hypothetical protein
MTISQTSRVNLARTRSLGGAVHYLRDRRVILVLAALAVIGGVAMSWGWLVALGIAPILLATLPCLVMCGVCGFCMSKMSGSSSAPQATQPDSETSSSQSLLIAQGTPTIGDHWAHVSSCCGGNAAANISADQRKVEGQEKTNA